METKSQMSLREAFEASPGPGNIQASFILMLKGLCMGTADIIPGVSGGTIALITGIYQDLLKAIKSFNLTFLSHLLHFEIRQAIATVHLRFLIPLLTGICIAIVSLARLMHFLLNQYPAPTWAFFFGLILASIFILGRKITYWAGTGGLFFLLGTLAGYAIVGMIPVSTPNTPAFIFFSGMIAICAMILPGISGAFLLLILGKYAFITGALKNPLIWDNLFIILTFTGGCCVGIVIFSRVLSYLFERHYPIAIATLTGLMFGSMRKIWPWKEVLEQTIIRGKVHVLRERNILPPDMDGMVYFACLMAVMGLILVFLLNKLSDQSNQGKD